MRATQLLVFLRYFSCGFVGSTLAESFNLTFHACASSSVVIYLIQDSIVILGYQFALRLEN